MIVGEIIDWWTVNQDKKFQLTLLVNIMFLLDCKKIIVGELPLFIDSSSTDSYFCC